MPRRRFAVLLTLSAACGAAHPIDEPDAGTDPTGDADPTGDGAGPDGTAPTMAMVTPADGAAGVRAGAEIVLVFSEPMNLASVQAAWTSADLPISAVAFTWNAIGDTLTVTPSAPLELATGTGEDPSVVVPRAYAFGVAATATDASGMPLAAPLASSFTTARRMTVDLAMLSPLTRTVRSDGQVLAEGASVRAVGDTTGNLQYKTFVTFSLPAVPAGVEIEDATLAAYQSTVDGAPYAFGDLIANHVSNATLGAAAFSAVPLATVGVLSSTAAAGDRSLDVAAAFGDDLAHHAARGEHTQYRLEFPTGSDFDGVSDAANLRRVQFGLTVTYLAD